MADVIATETGVKKVQLAVVDHRYVITVPGTYRLRLNAPVSPFPTPSAPWVITGIVPPSATIDSNPQFTLTGSGFLALVPLIPAAGAYAVDGELVSPGPLAISIPSDDTMYVDGVVPATVALAGLMVAPVIRLSAPGYLDVDSPSWTPLPAPTSPLDDAYYVPYTGGAGKVAIPVGASVPLEVNGAAMYEVTVNPPTPVPPVEDWSYAMWFRRRDYDGGLIWFSDHGDLTWNFKFYNGAIESVEAYLDGGPFPSSPPLSMPSNDYNWHLAVLVRDWSVSGQMFLYLDGVLVDTTGINPVHKIYGGPWTAGKTDLPPMPSVQAAGAVWYRKLLPGEVSTLWSTTTFPP